MNKIVFSLLAVASLVLTVVRFLPDVQEKFPGVVFWRSPVQEVESALKKRSQGLLKASATHHGQAARTNQAEAELTQVRNRKQDELKQIEFLTSELQKCSHSDAMLTIHGVSLRKQDVEADLEGLVLATEELVRREELLKGLIARLQETTIQAAADLAKARGDLLAAENWLHEKKADLALAEVRRWSGSNEDPLVRIASGEDELEEARRELERELAETGIGSISPTEPGRPWSRWSSGHVTSAAEIQSRAQKLLAGKSDESYLAAKPTQN